jgi:hypothetical protein
MLLASHWRRMSAGWERMSVWRRLVLALTLGPPALVLAGICLVPVASIALLCIFLGLFWSMMWFCGISARHELLRVATGLCSVMYIIVAASAVKGLIEEKLGTGRQGLSPGDNAKAAANPPQQAPSISMRPALRYVLRFYLLVNALVFGGFVLYFVGNVSAATLGFPHHGPPDMFRDFLKCEIVLAVVLAIPVLAILLLRVQDAATAWIPERWR